jgi:Na+/phosphate symporter
MKSTALTPWRHSSAAVRRLGLSAVPLLGTVPAAAFILVGPQASCANAAGRAAVVAATPWYVSAVITLVAAAIPTSSGLIIAAVNRAHAKRRDAWTLKARHFRSIEDGLLALGAPLRTAQRDVLHVNDAAASELQRMQQIVQQYVGHVPEGLSSALEKVVEAIEGIVQNLLPEPEELERLNGEAGSLATCLPWLLRGADQKRAVRRLAVVLQNARAALDQAWGAIEK